MAIASVVFGLLAMFGYIAFHFSWGTSGVCFWAALIASAAAALLGYLARRRPYAASGLGLGIAGLVIGGALFLYLRVGANVSGPI